MKIKLITLFSALSACLIAPDASLQAIEYSTPKPTNQTLPNQQTPNPDATPKAVESTNHNTNGQNPNIQIEQDPTLINILNINPEVPEDNRISIVYPGAIRPSHLSSVSNPNCYLDVSSRLCFFVWPNQRKTGDLEITWNLYLPDRTNETMKFRSVTLDNFLTPSETTIHLYTHKDKSLNLRYTTTVAYLPKKINGCEGCEGCGILWSDHGDGFAKLHSSTSQVPLIRIRYQKNSGISISGTICAMITSELFFPAQSPAFYQTCQKILLPTMGSILPISTKLHTMKPLFNIFIRTRTGKI